MQHTSKLYELPNSDLIEATGTSELKHELQSPTKDVDIVPDKYSVLISQNKLTEVGYLTVFGKKGVYIYDGKQPNFLQHLKQCCNDIDANTPTCGTSPSSPTYKTKTQTQSSSTGICLSSLYQTCTHYI